MASLFSACGSVVGFDGSQLNGAPEISSVLDSIFSQHMPPQFVAIVRSLRLLTPEIAMLRAVVGMVADGKDDLVPGVNAVQTLIASRSDGRWRIELFQNTPAAFHGEPEKSEQLSKELRGAIGHPLPGG